MNLFDEQTENRAAAIRRLLAQPLVVRSRDEDVFRTVASHRSALERWFTENLGWKLDVDLRAGIARLHKRASRPDPRRGLRRIRGSGRPFDPLRYQTLALVCAELLRRPHTTLGDLADAVVRLSAADEALREMDPTRHVDRLAFVDVLQWLESVGAIQVNAGELEGFSASPETDAVLQADTTVIPLLLSSDRPPARIESDRDPGRRAEAESSEEWIDALMEEPRYGTAAFDPEGTDPERRARWARHQVMRGLLDDPALDLDALQPAVRDYLFTPAGRDKALSIMSEAGFESERHADLWLAVDPSRESTPRTFSTEGRGSTVQQAASILLQELVILEDSGERKLASRSIEELESALRRHLESNPGWAKSARTNRGIMGLFTEAIALLEEFGLVRRLRVCQSAVSGESRDEPRDESGDEEWEMRIEPRPVAGRFLVHLQIEDSNLPEEASTT